MSQTLQVSYDRVKKLRLLCLTDLKPCEIFSLLFVGFSLISSISLVLYTAFSPATKSHWLRFPDSNRSQPIPDSIPTNISHILFGIGGSAATWRDRSRYSAVWWVPNLTRGFVWLDKKIPTKGSTPGSGNSAPPEKISSPEWVKFKFSRSRSAVRIARIISDSFKLKLPNVRWFVMGDDDTVYFTDNLVSVLARYDHNRMWYIGGNSESVEQDVMHTYDMAFGGGGFAISYTLAERLVNIIDGCLDSYFYFYGSDQRIWACVSEIGVGLTRERGFHQLDIRGSPYGLLSAHPLSPLVSLHHLPSLDPLFPGQNQLDSIQSLYDAYQLDPPRILQQEFCHDLNRKWSISISWGYTVQLYPYLLAAHKLETPLQTFKTWRSWSNGPFTFNTRAMLSDPCQQPLVFMLEHVREVQKSGTLSSYRRVVLKPEHTCNRTDYKYAMSVQKIDVSAMKLDPDYWTKVPRRYCCELMNKGRIKDGNMQIRVRKCRPKETVTI